MQILAIIVLFSLFLAHCVSASAPPKKSKVLNDSTNKRKLRTSSPLKVPSNTGTKVSPILVKPKPSSTFATGVVQQSISTGISNENDLTAKTPEYVSVAAISVSQNLQKNAFSRFFFKLPS